MSSTTSRWPSATDYVAAVQDPESCLIDERLRRAEFVMNRMGIPVVKSGQTAAVFPLTCGGERAALRLFTMPTEQAERYERLAEHLAQRPCELFVPSEWIPSAVAFGRGTYPAVLMPWVAGATLSSFVDDAVEDGRHATLRELADNWRTSFKLLTESGVVHGDLQHGNVLVGGDLSVRLIDYDGCWVPGLPTDLAEVGHPNYQHPQRLEEHRVASNTDVFSAFVIHVSLLAVAADPGLWERFHNEENLIFTQQDFTEARRRGGPLWQELERSPDPDVVKHAETLIAICGVSLESIPSLEALLSSGPEAIGGARAFVPERAGRSAGATWWDAELDEAPPLAATPRPPTEPRFTPPPTLPPTRFASPTPAPTVLQSVRPVEVEPVDRRSGDAAMRRVALVMILLALAAAATALGIILTR